ncbi:thiamine pyrophosphate-dependent dehydrogenase E1 component subunit alpha [Niveibacterium sp. SC-1]|uniref:thiamine pyrophosphate-dependent dehydrogenase E1 component subunit alpha n=1 Tax=Niveibacterium sp. SC-1 TaxID=3135646 RepID=UPI00311F21B0
MLADIRDGDAVRMLERMLLVRGYEQLIVALGKGGNFPITCSALGQEASAVGVMSALGEADRILTNHRSAGHLMARGAEPGRLLAEVMGKATGYCGGKSGSLHISVKELGVLLTSTIVGGELSLATGVALSKKMLKEPGVVACFFGDGAACEGVFHESLNLASAWALPVLYVCENNQWQAFVSRREAMRNEHVSDWAAGYRVPGRTVDGNDVFAVREATQEAVRYIRETGRPYLLETCTYRLAGHYSLDDQAYVDAQELADWRARDPILRLREQVLAMGPLDEAGLEALDARVAAQLDEARRFALESPYPDVAALTADVLA